MNDDQLEVRRQARDQARLTVGDAFGTRAGASRAREPLTQLKEEERSGVTPPTPRKRLWRTGAEVDRAAEEAGELYWPVPGLIPPLTSLFFGDPKAGKTTVALDVAVNVASGNPCLGGVATHLGDVLYIAAETGSPELSYMRREMWPTEDWPLRLSLIPLEDYSEIAQTMPLLQLLDEWKAEATKPTLIIIDTLGKVILGPAERKAPTSSMYNREYAAMERLTRWSSENRVALMALHHSNQVTEKNRGHWSHAASGTAGLLGAAEDYMYLERRKAEDETGRGGLRLRAEGRSFSGEQDWTLVRSGRNLTMFSTVDVSERHGSKMKAVAECAITHWPEVSIEQIEKTTGIGRATVRVYCHRLVEKGVFERVGDGVFRMKTDSRGQA